MKTFIRAFRIQGLGCMLMLSLILCHGHLHAQKKKNVRQEIKGYGNASYQSSHAGHFMKQWLLAGPFPMTIEPASTPDMPSQEKYFDADVFSQVNVQSGERLLPIQLNGKSISWLGHSSQSDIVDLDALYGHANYAAVYALAEVMADSSYTAFLAIGSDDGVKVWLNGKMVHKLWMSRGVTPDQDIIPIHLIKGSNQLLIKVQDTAGDWGFAARLLDKPALSDRLIIASGNGNLDDVDLLLNSGADIERKNAVGFTPLAFARLRGRQETVELLLQKGARETPVPSPDSLIWNSYNFLNKDKAPGIAALVAKDGKVIYKKAFGYADIENKVPVSTDTKFRIGSITKQFIAAAILKLQEGGHLQVTDKLSKYFPDFPRGEEVTLHHLLTHTSGIQSYTGKSDFLSRVVKPVTNDELLDYFKHDRYNFNPGEGYLYNNSGYFLLGYIIEKVSGKTYGQYLKDAFFDPLQMRSTGVHASTLSLTNEAFGYTKEGNKFIRALNWDMSWAGGAGGLYSTVEDLYLWNEAVFNGKVLSKKSWEVALTPVILNNGKIPGGIKYGYGWGLDDYRGQDVVEHGGSVHGFLSQLARFPEENLTVAILTNITPAIVDINPHTLAEFYLWEKMDKQTSYSVKASPVTDLKIYEGRYDFNYGSLMTITSDGTQLHAQLSRQSKFPIFPSGQDEFSWKVVDARIKFIRNDKGEVVLGHFEQGSFKIDAAKLPEEVIVKVDTSVYNDYAGRYDADDNTYISVTSESGKLFFQSTHQPRVEIFPLSEKEFTMKDIKARFTFFRESDGKVSKMIIDVAGQKREARKTD